jgi:glutamate transport system substrate-binding protein
MSACSTRRILAASTALLLALTACSEPYDEDFTLPNGYGTTPADELPPAVQKIKDRGELRAGVSIDAPGFGLRDPKTGQVEGFDAEMARLIAIRIFGTPSKVKFVEVTSAQRPDVLKNGTVDIVAATYTITPERAKIVGFVGPYFNAGQDILVKAGNKSIKSVKDLAGRKVCTQKGTTSLDQLVKAQPSAVVTTTDSFLKCAEGVKAGTYEAVTTDNVILAGLAADSLGALALVGELFSDESYGIGIARDNDDLRTFLNTTMSMVFLNGDWNRAWMRTLYHFFGPAPEIPTLAPNPGAV